MKERTDAYRCAEGARRVKDLPAPLQPREEFRRFGAENVSDAVLLALLIRSGVPGENVRDLAARLLAHYGSLTALARAPVQELERFRGIGPVTAQVLKAAMELAHRLSREAVGSRPEISSPARAAEVLRERARVLRREVFWVLVLDTRNRLVGEPVVLSQGTLDQSPVHPREVFRAAIERDGAAILLAHNHPSGDPTPSAADVAVTRRLVEAGRLMGVRVLDHVILGRPEGGRPAYVSLRESGAVEFEP